LGVFEEGLEIGEGLFGEWLWVVDVVVFAEVFDFCYDAGYGFFHFPAVVIGAPPLWTERDLKFVFTFLLLVFSNSYSRFGHFLLIHKTELFD
jgi:hypothetical protein